MSAMSMTRATRSSRRRSLTPTAIAASTLVCWLATAVAAAAFWPVYQSPRFLLMVAVTTVVASAIAIGGAVLRLPGQIVALAVLVAYLFLGVPLAIPDRAAFGVLPTVQGLVDLATGSVLGWKQLLTITLPVGDFQSLLVPAFVTVLITVSVSMSLALRSRIGELAVIGPVVLFVTGILFGPTTEFAPVLLGLALTAVLLLWIVWFRLHRRRIAILAARGTTPGRERDPLLGSARTALGAIVIIAIASGGAVAATAVAPPSADRRVLRSAVVQPFDPREYPSPLSGLRGYFDTEDAQREMLAVDGLPEGGRIRIATLDTYDGVVYTVGSDAIDSESAAFTLVPSAFDQSGVAGTQVAIDVTVEGYRGVWVPTTGKLESIAFQGAGAGDRRGAFYYNDNSGTAAVIGGVQPGDRYRLTAVEPRRPDRSELADLQPGDANVPALQLPDSVSTKLMNYTAAGGSPGAQLQEAISGLREEGYISHGQTQEGQEFSRSGHSLDRIDQLVSDQRMIGDQEQYAVVAAMMASELGFPARVVFGFAPEVTGGTTIVRGADASAWIEVDTAGFGWVAIDPTPPERPIPEETPEVPQPLARPQQPVQPPVDEPAVPDDQTPQDADQEDPPAEDPLLAALLVAGTIVGWLAVAAAVVVSPFLAIVARKVGRRRRRRRADTPLARISGGWDEFEDAAIDHGYEPPPSTTRSEFAGVVGGPLPLALAAVADRAVFSPTPPEASDADEVWTTVSELETSLDRGLTRWQRIKALGSLRSLRPRQTADDPMGSTGGDS